MDAFRSFKFFNIPLFEKSSDPIFTSTSLILASSYRVRLGVVVNGGNSGKVLIRMDKVEKTTGVKSKEESTNVKVGENQVKTGYFQS